MKWLTDLIDEFSTPAHLPKQSRIERMAKLWKGIPQPVMDTAVDKYIINAKHPFFPAISELRPFVDAALIEFNSGVKLRNPASDREIYEWELMRGTMRPLDEIEAEIEIARNELQLILSKGKEYEYGK